MMSTELLMIKTAAPASHARRADCCTPVSTAAQLSRQDDANIVNEEPQMLEARH
jgi:hypothetical protein